MTPSQQKLIDAADEKSRCGHGAVVMLNTENGAIKLVPTFCHAWRCERCGPRLAAIWRRKIVNSRPERFITLTWDPASDHTIDEAVDIMKAAVARLASKLRQQGFRFEYCAIWEFTKKGWPHLHLAQRGDFIPQRTLSKLWSSLGCGTIVDIRKVKSAQALSFELTKYLLKSTRETAVLLERRRIIQCSRNFLIPLVNDDAPAEDPVYKSFFLPHALFAVASWLERVVFYELITSDRNGTLYFLPTEFPTGPVDSTKGFEDLFQAILKYNPNQKHAPPLEDHAEGQSTASSTELQLALAL